MTGKHRPHLAEAGARGRATIAADMETRILRYLDLVTVYKMTPAQAQADMQIADSSRRKYAAILRDRGLLP